jgi:hypothetical protein
MGSAVTLVIDTVSKGVAIVYSMLHARLAVVDAAVAPVAARLADVVAGHFRSSASLPSALDICACCGSND